MYVELCRYLKRDGTLLCFLDNGSTALPCGAYPEVSEGEESPGGRRKKFVRTVLKAARIVPRSVRRKPNRVQ